MREILRTSSLSFAESSRLALEAEGIPALISNENLGALPPTAITVAITDDADYDRALIVLRDLQQTTAATSPRAHRVLSLVLVVLLGVFLVLCANSLLG
jgi:hypothetical protein